MSLVINSNMTASRSALNLNRSNDLLRKSMLRLSSGKRIINPADDAGGLAVGLKLQSALRRTAATKHNIQNGVSYLQMQDGALKVVGSVLDRMAELKSYSNDITKNEQDRQNYNYEFKELQEEGNAMGFKHVASGPLVRSSYHADEQHEAATKVRA